MLVVSYKQEEKKSLVQKYQKVFNISAWSFVLVVSTIGMALFGMWLDKILDTQPMLMCGLMVLGTICAHINLYLNTL